MINIRGVLRSSDALLDSSLSLAHYVVACWTKFSKSPAFWQGTVNTGWYWNYLTVMPSVAP